MITETVWEDCYELRWKGLICDEAHIHPAKFARGLIQRIIETGLQRGYWKSGDQLADCFGGVALGGIVSGYMGMNWIGVELEPKFHELGNRNLYLHEQAFKSRGVTVRLVQGDSRGFAKIVRDQVVGICTSPPYADTLVDIDDRGSTFVGQSKQASKEVRAQQYQRKRLDGIECNKYGGTQGQIGSMPVGIVTSPPYAETIQGKAKDPEKIYAGMSKRNCLGRVKALKFETELSTYGDTPGQIGQLTDKGIQGVVTSPPYADTVSGHTKDHVGVRQHMEDKGYRGNTIKKISQHSTDSNWSYGTTSGQIGRLRLGTQADAIVTSPPFTQGFATGGGINMTGYGPEGKDKVGSRTYQGTAGEKVAGNIESNEGETYWSAMRQVYTQCKEALKPGGVMAVVVKDYIKDGKRVELCEQTIALLTSVGFEVFERVYAMLVKEKRNKGLFGDDVVDLKERKSFFRRLAEQKGSPNINWEEVILCRVPVQAVQIPRQRIESGRPRL